MRGNMPIYRITNILLKNFPVSLAFLSAIYKLQSTCYYGNNLWSLCYSNTRKISLGDTTPPANTSLNGLIPKYFLLLLPISAETSA